MTAAQDGQVERRAATRAACLVNCEDVPVPDSDVREDVARWLHDFACRISHDFADYPDEALIRYQTDELLAVVGQASRADEARPIREQLRAAHERTNALPSRARPTVTRPAVVQPAQPDGTT